MSYLTFEEFKELSVVDEIDESTFKRLLPKASAVMDYVTNQYYQYRDMEKDNSWRVSRFKQALSTQIEYFHILGATTFEEINNAPQTFSAGRTSVSNASRYNPNGANESKPIVAEDVYIFLEGTGLLYSGVQVW